MVARRTSGQGKARSKATAVEIDPSAIDHAVRLIDEVCCFAGSFDLLKDTRDEELCAAIERRDNAALFDRLTFSFSFQGISDEIAANYMRRHGQATFRSVRKNSGQAANLPEAESLLAFSRLPIPENETHLRRA